MSFKNGIISNKKFIVSKSYIVLEVIYTKFVSIHWLTRRNRVRYHKEKNYVFSSGFHFCVGISYSYIETRILANQCSHL